MSEFKASYHPVPFKPTPLKALICKARPIVISHDNKDYRLSIDNAENLVKQLNNAINRSILGQLNQRITKSGEVLQFHEINGIPYFTCPNQ